MADIISASRRTDIPAFYTEWLMEKLKEGSVDVLNPYNNTTCTVSLKPEDVSCMVFWSKNYAPMLSHLETIERISPYLYFHFTITGVPKELELHTPAHKNAIRDFIYLAKRYSSKQLVWRFDPIVITDKAPFEHYKESFTKMAEMLRGHCVKVYTSFFQSFEKAVRNIEKYSDHRLINVSEEDKKAFADELAQIATANGMTLYACCNSFLLSAQVQQAHCIHKDILNDAFGTVNIKGSNKPTRKGCGCSYSRDIGKYDTCPHGCLYCYANQDTEKIQGAYKESGGNLL